MNQKARDEKAGAPDDMEQIDRTSEEEELPAEGDVMPTDHMRYEPKTVISGRYQQPHRIIEHLLQRLMIMKTCG